MQVSAGRRFYNGLSAALHLAASLYLPKSLEFGPSRGASGDLLRKDPSDACGLERVQLGVQGLAGGGGSGVADPYMCCARQYLERWSCGFVGLSLGFDVG
jgi:hypothetical protein